MVILDAMEKTAGVRLLQAELNDMPGVCLKLDGPLGDIEAAAGAARLVAEAMRVRIVADVIPGPDPAGRPAWEVAPDFNALFEQATVQVPLAAGKKKGRAVMQQSNFAVGLIETQGTMDRGYRATTFSR